MGIRVTNGKVVGKIRLDLRHKNTPFNMKALYEFMHDWLLEEGFHDDTGSDKFLERYYWQQTTERGKNIWFWWRTYAGEEKTKSSYFEYHIDMDFQILGMQDVEVVIKDKKVKLNKAEIIITLRGYMVFDPKGLLSKHPIIKTMYHIFPRFWLHKEIDMHKAAARKELYDFYAALKKYFEQQNFGDTFPNFHPNMGIGH